MTTFRILSQFCPLCFTILDTATPIAGKGPPEAGDHTVCIECGAVLRFGSDLELLPAKLEDVDITVRAKTARMILFIQERRAGKLGQWRRG